MEPTIVPPPQQPAAEQPNMTPVKPPDENPPLPNGGKIVESDPENPDGIEVINSDRHEGTRSVITTISILVLAPVIALFITSFCFQSYQVDGQSMETTLQNQDRLIVWKLPRTIGQLIHHPYVPHRTDVIILSKSDLYQFDGVAAKKQLVKRVMGLPGDRVVVKDGMVTVYNKEHPDGFDPDTTYPYGKVIVTTPGDVDVTLKKDEIYVMGDNRTNSLDSRIFGPVKLSEITGRLELRIFPFNKAQKY